MNKQETLVKNGIKGTNSVHTDGFITVTSLTSEDQTSRFGIVFHFQDCQLCRLFPVSGMRCRLHRKDPDMLRV